MKDRFTFGLDWNLLRTFVAVVEHQHISKAADYLGLRQPTVSLALQRLETSVGQKLIERGPSQFRVTVAGQILYQESKAIFATVENLPNVINAADATLTGHISMALTSYIASTHFDELLANFHKTHQQVTFSVTVEQSAQVLQHVEQGQVTLGVCLLAKKSRNIQADVLFREQFGLYCGKEHPLFQKENVRISDLEGENSVTFQTELDEGPLSEINLMRAKAGLNLRSTGVSANLPELRRMLTAGMGIGALPVHVAKRDVLNGDLKQLPPFEGLPKVDVYVVHSKKRKFSRTELAFIETFNAFVANTALNERTYR